MSGISSAFRPAHKALIGYITVGYPDVKATASDTVNGIVFYFVLLIPFSFFMERRLRAIGQRWPAKRPIPFRYPLPWNSG